MNERETLKINDKGHLEIGGADCVELAKEFGTPLYLFDEAQIRKMMRVYRDTLREYYGDNGMVLYASKAFSCKAIYRIADEENIGVDVVSGGELYTALQADFPAKHIYMHGNNKLDYEIGEALDAGIGCIVADAISELDKILSKPVNLSTSFARAILKIQSTILVDALRDENAKYTAPSSSLPVSLYF